VRALSTMPVIATDSLERFQHDNRVTADYLCKISVRIAKNPQRSVTYHHAQLHLLASILLLDRIVQDNVQKDLAHLSTSIRKPSRRATDIVSTEDTNDLAAAIELDEQPLVEVLLQRVSQARLPSKTY